MPHGFCWVRVLQTPLKPRQPGKRTHRQRAGLGGRRAFPSEECSSDSHFGSDFFHVPPARRFFASSCRKHAASCNAHQGNPGKNTALLGQLSVE